MEMGGEKPNAKILRMAGDLHLPEPIIHGIQYFLNAREAARTATLSKSWGSAWLTRPNIDLDETSYNNKNPNAVDFPVFAKKTIQRYEESKLKIDSFSLLIRGSTFNANELIVKALEMGATRLELTARSRYVSMEFALTNEVFAGENLIGLSVEGFLIDLGPDQEVRCSKLQSLRLKSVGVKIRTNFIANITSRCHLIRDLSLCNIYEYDNKGPRLVGYHNGYVYGNRVLGLGPIDFPSLRNIRRMMLSCVYFDVLFLGDLWSEFSSLKDLTLKYYSKSVEDLRISSRSLELLNFTVGSSMPMRVEFDVPSIRKFTFEGPLIESLSFKTTSREWESRLSISCRDLSTSWFLQLSMLVSQFSRSKLHLSCCFTSSKSLDYEVEHLRGLPKYQVENLIMDTECLPVLNYFAVFDGLFRICRPKCITQYLLPESSFRWETKNHYLCKMLEQQINEKCSFGMRRVHGLDYLKQANAQVFDEVVGEWQDIPFKSLLDASPSSQENQKIRFELEWRA